MQSQGRYNKKEVQWGVTLRREESHGTRQGAKWCGQKLRHAGSHQNLKDAGDGFSPGASRGSGRLTPPFQVSDADFGQLASKTRREFISVVFSCQVGDASWQQLQETPCPNASSINHDVWEGLTLRIFAFLISTPPPTASWCSQLLSLSPAFLMHILARGGLSQISFL